MRQLRFLRLLEVKVIMHTMPLIGTPLRMVTRTRPAPLGGHIAGYNPCNGCNPYLQPVLVEQRAGGQPTQRPGLARCGAGSAGSSAGPRARRSTSTSCWYGLRPWRGL